MEKRFGVLLCTAVCIGAMSAVSVKADNIIINSGDSETYSSQIDLSGGNFTNNGDVTVANTGSIENTGTFINEIDASVSNAGQINANRFENKSMVTNTNEIQAGQFVNTGTLSGAGDLAVSNGGSNSGAGNSITQNNISIEGGTFTNSAALTANTKLTNAGSISNTSTIIAKEIDNQLSITGAGTLTVNNGGSNSGTITQGIINTTAGNLSNSGTLTANGAFTNGAAISGNGNLNINAGGSSNSTISQKNISISSSFDNNAALTANTKLTNSGSIDNSSDISASSLQNNSGAKIEGTGNLTASGTNAGTIKQNSVKLNGALTNTGSIETGALTTSSNTITNNNSLKITNSAAGTIRGTGNTELAGTNSADINQGSVTVTGDLTNNGSIIAGTIINNAELTNNEILGNASSNITNNGAITNNKTITANSIINQTNKTILNEGSLTTNTLTNNGIITNNSDIVVNSGLANASGATITGTGDLSISGSNSLNSGSIEQKDISISGTLTNNGALTSTGILTNNGTIHNNNTVTGIVAQEIDNKAGATIDGTGNITIKGGSNSGSITQNNVNVENIFTNDGSLSVTGTLTNSGTIHNNNTVTGIVAQEIDNIAGATIDGTGNITIKGGSNSGSITQNNVTIQNTFTNEGTLTANGTFANTAVISGAGDLNINAGGKNSAGSITQDNITISGTFNNSADLTANELLTNNGTINNTSNIIAESIDNQSVIQGSTGKLTVGGGSNSGTIQQSSVTLNGNFTNNSTANLETTKLDTKTNTLTNKGNLKVTSTTSGKIDGNGTLDISGSNSAEINQGTVNIIGDLENNNSIIADAIENKTGVTLTNKGTLGDNSSNITNKGVLNNSGSIISNSISNAASASLDNKAGASIIANTIKNEGSLTNAGSIGDSANKVSIVNTGTKFENNGSIIAITIDNRANLTNNKDITTDSIQNASNVTISGNNGSLTINNGGSNEGTIIQKDINVTGGTLENSGNITAKGTLSNAGTINTTSSSVIITEAINNTANILGDGNITINGGENASTGKIEQNNVTLNNTLINDGIITSKGTFTNNAVISGEGTLNINNGISNKAISQKDVNVTGTFENKNTLDVSGELTNSGTIKNSSVITAVINNTTSGVIEGANGQIKISGTSVNAGNIKQAVVGVIGGTLDNSGSITADTFTNDGTINDTLNTGSLTVNTTGTNNGAITQNVLTNNGILTNNDTASITAGTLNNNKKLNNKGTIVVGDFNNIANAELTNDGTFTVNGEMNNKGSIMNKGTFNSGAGSTLKNDGTFINSGAEAKMSATNIINNKIFGAQDGASLTLENIENNGTIQINNGSSIIVTDQNDILGGIINVDEGLNTFGVKGAEIQSTINIGTNEVGTILKAVDGTVNNNAKVTIAAGSALNIAGADVTLNNNDSWKGSVTLDSGALTVDNIKNGQLIANAGKLTIAENGGELVIGSDSKILAAVDTTISENSTLNISGGSVELNAGDTWDGTIELGTGAEDDTSSLTVGLPTADDIGTLHAKSGNLEVLNNLNLSIGDGSYIMGEVALQTSGNIKITDGGLVYIDNNDTLGAGAKVTLTEGGTLYYGKSDDAAAMVDATAGNLHLLSGSKLTLSSGSNIQDAVALDIQNGATLTLKESLTLNLDNADTWDGQIINENGVINTNGLTKSSSTASLIQSNGELNLYNDSSVILGSNSEVSGGQINITKGEDGSEGSILTIVDAAITGGDMTIDKDSKFVVKSGTFKLDSLNGSGVVNEDGSIQASLVNVMNNQINTSEIVSANIDTQTNFNIDIHARSNKKTNNDQFILGSLEGDGILMVEDWGLNGDIYGWDAPIDRHIKLKDVFITGDDNKAQIAVTDKTRFTPIGWYQLNKNDVYEDDVLDESGNIIQKGSLLSSGYTLDLVKYNPQVFRGQVATVAQWMNQLNINDMLFTHSMVLPSFKEPDGGKMANRYAAESPLFAPYQYSRKDGGLWYKMYGTFENLQMNNGLGRVGNNAYGALIGADFGLKELKNGWSFMPTAYVGYNGAHQTFAHMGQYQNGGQAGFLGTWYKDNFIIGALAYGGIYDNSMDVHGFTDETFNYFAGAATKFAYNVRLHKDWVLQPNLFASYNYFGQQNWHSKFGQMGMMAGDLNGVNIAPGLNLIWEKETFSAYATLQYMYNINGACGGRAGNVGLPKMEMERGYIQYGLGINKKFTNRASGYLQAVLRNVGRTGVGFQAGFNYMIGK